MLLGLLVFSIRSQETSKSDPEAICSLKTLHCLPPRTRSATRIPSTMSEALTHLVGVANNLCVIELCLAFDPSVAELTPA